MADYRKAHKDFLNRDLEAGAVNVYAGLEVVQQAIESVGEIDRKKIRDVIASGKFQTVCGELNYVNERNADPGRGRVAERCIGPFPSNKVGAKPLLFPKPAWSRRKDLSARRSSRVGPSSSRTPVFFVRVGSGVVLFEVFLSGLLLGGSYGGSLRSGTSMQFGGVARISIRRRVPDGPGLHSLLRRHAVEGEPAAGACWSACRSRRAQLADLPACRRCLAQARAPDQDALDADVVLVTFGLLLICQGWRWSTGAATCAATASSPSWCTGAGATVLTVLLFLGACALALALFLLLRRIVPPVRRGAARHHHRSGGGSLVGVDVVQDHALASPPAGRSPQYPARPDQHVHLLQRHLGRR